MLWARSDNGSQGMRAWRHHWPRNSGPADDLHFASAAAAAAIVAASGRDAKAVADRFEADDLGALVVTSGPTPLQVFLVAGHVVGGDKIYPSLAKAEQRMLITP